MYRDLVDVWRDLGSCQDMSTAMAVVSSAVRRLAGAEGATLVLREGSLCHYVDEDAIAPLWKGRRFPMESCISGWCMLHRQAVAIEDVYADSRIPHDAYRPTFVRSLAMVPIRLSDPIGAIGAYWSKPHPSTPEELERLQMLAESASVVHNVKLLSSLKQASRRKDLLLSRLAGAMRDPLATLRNSLHAMAGEPERQEWARAIMERQVQRLNGLLDDLSEAVQLDSGRLVIRRQRLDLRQVAHDAVDDFDYAARAAGLAMSLDTPQRDVWVAGDYVRLHQALGNVLENAIRFTPPDGRIDVRVRAHDSRRLATVAVRDTGIGLDPQRLRALFEPADSGEHAAQTGGLGLGLQVAKALVELHGGSIEAASEGAGTGATITLNLPLAP